MASANTPSDPELLLLLIQEVRRQLRQRVEDGEDISGTEVGAIGRLVLGREATLEGVLRGDFGEMAKEIASRPPFAKTLH